MKVIINELYTIQLICKVIHDINIQLLYILPYYYWPLEGNNILFYFVDF